MPCDSGPSWDDELRARADAAAKAACEMALRIRTEDAKMPKGHKGITMFSRLSRETKQWVRDHDELDKDRRRREEKLRLKKDATRRALQKLSPKERKLLNLQLTDESESESESEESED